MSSLDYLSKRRFPAPAGPAAPELSAEAYKRCLAYIAEASSNLKPGQAGKILNRILHIAADSHDEKSERIGDAVFGEANDSFQGRQRQRVGSQFLEIILADPDFRKSQERRSIVQKPASPSVVRTAALPPAPPNILTPDSPPSESGVLRKRKPSAEAPPNLGSVDIELVNRYIRACGQDPNNRHLKTRILTWVNSHHVSQRVPKSNTADDIGRAISTAPLRTDYLAQGRLLLDYLQNPTSPETIKALEGGIANAENPQL